MREFRRRPTSTLPPQEDTRSRDALVQVVRTGASATEVLSEKDLTMVRADELSELSRIAARMVWAFARHAGRVGATYTPRGGVSPVVK